MRALFPLAVGLVALLLLSVGTASAEGYAGFRDYPMPAPSSYGGGYYSPAPRHFAPLRQRVRIEIQDPYTGRRRVLEVDIDLTGLRPENGHRHPPMPRMPYGDPQWAYPPPFRERTMPAGYGFPPQGYCPPGG